MGEKELEPRILDALAESSKVIDENSAILEALSNSKEKANKKSENVIDSPAIESSLSSAEKSRYAAIGKELFSPILSSLEKMLKKEKKKNEMLIKDDSDTIENAVHIQYEHKCSADDNGGVSWLTILLGILAVAGAAIVFFKDEIAEFFPKVWNWISEKFSSISNFFNIDDPNSPINKVFNFCKEALEALWPIVRTAFNKLADIASVIWDNIKEGWDKFITGPNGILNFGSKVISGLVGFAGDAIRWIGSAIKDAVVGPLSSIFSSAEEDGADAGKAAAQEVRATANQQVADQNARNAAIREEALFNADRTNEMIAESTRTQREEALRRAREQGLQVQDGAVTEDSLKEAAARAGLDAFMRANNITDATPEEYEKYKNEFMKFVEVRDGEARINMQALQTHLRQQADNDSSMWTNETDFIDKLQNMNTEQMDQINGNVTAALQRGLDITSELQAVTNLENMTDEERFEARLRLAMNTGKTAEFRFMEGRRMILESTETIKSAFLGYDEQIRNNFTTTWSEFIDKFLNQIKINISTTSPQDNSTNTYNIMPLHKETFTAMADQLVSLAQESVEAIVKQNEVLDNICVLLANAPQNQNSVPPPILVDATVDSIDNRINYTAKGARASVIDLWNSVTSWG